MCKEKSNGIHDAHEEQQKAQIDSTNHQVGDQLRKGNQEHHINKIGLIFKMTGLSIDKDYG